MGTSQAEGVGRRRASLLLCVARGPPASASSALVRREGALLLGVYVAHLGILILDYGVGRVMITSKAPKKARARTEDPFRQLVAE